MGTVDIGTQEILRDVLYVPGLQHNLISVRALTKDGKDVIFKRDGTVETIDDENTHRIGQAVGDLYQLTDINALVATNAMGAFDDYTIWHQRFGHAGRNTIMSLAKYVTGLEKVKFTSPEGVCEGCVRAKSHRKPFGVATNRSKEILGRIHTDICGPIPNPSIGGARYILTFIDDATRFATIYALSKKSDTFELFMKYKSFTEKQTGKSIKILHSDGGGEYVNTEMREYLTLHGIHHETTTAETPEQNGVAERYNRTLLESLRAMMHSAGIPEPLWAELAVTAAYLRNRLPTRANTGQASPFELWHGRKPPVEHLRIIWSDAYAHIPKTKRTKLAPRAEKLKLIGYHDEKKAYKLWDPDEERLVISRDVVFDESVVLKGPPTVNPEFTNDDEYVIDAIIGVRNIDNENQYLVRWQGYSEDENTWEPYSHVADTKALLLWEENNRAQQEQRVFLAEAEIIMDDPTSYVEAVTSQEAKHWQAAIESELKSLRDNNTWTIVPLPLGRRPIGCKWIFKRKFHPDGSIARYKARLVAKGYSQQPGVDYEETFAPVAKFTSIRTVLTIGAILDLEIHQMDVKTAFLHGDLSEEIYMSIPDGIDQGSFVPKSISDESLRDRHTWVGNGWTQRRSLNDLGDGVYTLQGDQGSPGDKGSPTPVGLQLKANDRVRDRDRETQLIPTEDQGSSEDMRSSSSEPVCRLNRTLYGLKQSPRMWNKKINDFLVSNQGFTRLNADHSIYIRRAGGLAIIALYVDDLLLLTETFEAMQKLKGELSKSYEMTDCGEIHHFLGIKVNRDRNRCTISIDQEHFVNQVLMRFDMMDCKPVSTPLDPSMRLEQRADKDAGIDNISYRQIIGSLMFLMIGTRPDIAAAVSIVSQFAANPSTTHLQAVKRILRYLKGSKGYKLHLGGREIKLIGYSDANWGNDINTRKSTSGYVFYLGEGVICWSSKRQATVALSSTEAEYMALTHATKEAIWLRTLLEELGYVQETTTIYEDNQSSIALARNPVHHVRTKHIDIQHHFIREKVESKEVDLTYMPTDEMVGDALTKPLPYPKFAKFVTAMGLRR
ncbi:MAG: hypothetical protein PVS3B3_30240 [Ktedonobacteraceae bacterium]